jgi:hypothetical protein
MSGADEHPESHLTNDTLAHTLAAAVMRNISLPKQVSAS